METRARRREMEKLDELFRMGFVTESQYKERKSALENGRSQDHYQSERDGHFAPAIATFDSRDNSKAPCSPLKVDAFSYSSSDRGRGKEEKGKGKEKEEVKAFRWADFEDEKGQSGSWADLCEYEEPNDGSFATLQEPSWKKELSKEMTLPYFFTLMETLERESRSKTIFPPREEVFAAYNLTPLDDVNVVIIGQVLFIFTSISLSFSTKFLLLTL